MSKRAVVISCSDHYQHRMVYWDESLKDLGYSTTYVTTDFLHVEKKTYTCSVEGCVQLHVMPYRKNLSVQRILSHRMFARKVLRYLKAEKPDVVISLLPPNFLAKYLSAYKRRNPDTKLIFDIFDLWPETFPSSRIKKLLAPVFRVWSNLRDKHLPAADYVTSECDLFRQKLGLEEGRSETIPFSLPPYEGAETGGELPRDRADIAYLGSVNNIIDIPRIVAILSSLKERMPTALHIIGGGEKCDEFRKTAEDAGIDVHFYGKVFDEGEKHRILSGCHFGLNVMKNSVCVGLTMKSVDYFRHGLPIINTIPADTEKMVRTQGVGVHADSPDQAARDAAAMISAGIGSARDAVASLYNSGFTSDLNRTHCTRVLQRILPSEKGVND